jgi:rhodanese-related sulfurtransferase
MPKTITRDEVRRLIDAGDAVVVEALPAAYYEQEHLPGALNLPHDKVDQLAGSVVPDKTKPVVVYCARRLEELGYEAVYDYDLGKQDWVEAGLPTESGTPALAAD